MSTRVQVILDEKEAIRFRRQAEKESISLSAWLREAGRTRLRMSQPTRLLKDPGNLLSFFEQCDRFDETETEEPDWAEHKKVITGGYRRGAM